jgi:vancomycin permeability regulator SanA
MRYGFKLNDRWVRYDTVSLYRNHEIGLYGYYSKGEPIWMAAVDGDTVGYAPTAIAASDMAQRRIDELLARAQVLAQVEVLEEAIKKAR